MSLPAPLAPLLRPRHVPERSCVACRRKRPQAQFVRLIRAAGDWTFAGQGQAGRGAYVCADTPGCWAEKRLRRAFGAQAASLSFLLQTPITHSASRTRLSEPMN